jgi:hypothetical protein
VKRTATPAWCAWPAAKGISFTIPPRNDCVRMESTAPSWAIGGYGGRGPCGPASLWGWPNESI